MVGPNNLGDDSLPGTRKKRGKDPLKPGTEAFDKRQARHRHNGFMGSVRMSMMQMYAIIQAGTTTPEAKRLADVVLKELDNLKEALKKRVD